MQLLIIVVAKYLIALPIALIVWCLWTLRGGKRRELVLLSAVSLPLSYIVGFIAGHLYYSPRPFVVTHTAPLFAHAADNGFPSDHMLLAATLAMLGWSVNWRFGALLWLLALAIGFARVAAGVHHTLDLVGSAAIAIAVVVLVRYALTKVIFIKM